MHPSSTAALEGGVRPDCATASDTESTTASPLTKTAQADPTQELIPLEAEPGTVDQARITKLTPARLDEPSVGTRPRLLLMRQRYVVAAVGSALLVLVSGAGLYVHNQLDARDAVISVQQQQITDLTNATLAFQDELTATQADRDRLSSELGIRTGERDSLASQRDDVTNQLNAARQKLTETQASLDDTKGQLSQARQSGAAQQQRASSADARSNALTSVLKLDDQIHVEYANLLEQVRMMNQAFGRYDYFGAAAAYARTQTISDRLTQLFDQRKTALAAL